MGGEFPPVTREALLAILSQYPTLNIPSPASDDNEEVEPVAMVVGGMAFNLSWLSFSLRARHSSGVFP